VHEYAGAGPLASKEVPNPSRPVLAVLSDDVSPKVRLQAEQARLQNRLDAMYVDKLDGRVDAAFSDQKAAQSSVPSLRTIGEH